MMLARSADPAATLRKCRQNVDDHVVDGLLTLSYQAVKNDDVGQAMVWTDLAHEASLIGGTSKTHAEVLIRRATLLLDRWQRASEDRDQPGAAGATGEPDALLAAALESALKARDIHLETQATQDTPAVLQLIATIHRGMGHELSAFESQIECAMAWSEVVAEHEAGLGLSTIATLYWQLHTDDLEAGARILWRQSTALLAGVGHRIETRPIADLLDALGDACRTLGRQEEAFGAWSRAAALYHDVGAQVEEFSTRARMQDYAAQLELTEAAREHGEACIAAAPVTTPPNLLAGRYHLLAVTYEYLGRTADAVDVYHRAVELYSKDGPESGAAMPCLLEAALVENAAGLFKAARRDLERVLASPGGVFAYWIASTTLADVCWRRFSELGTAILHADCALELSISNTKLLACRANSLSQSGILHFTTGNIETAHRRFTQLVSILATTPEPTLIKVSPLYDYAVLPPSPARSTWWALRASRAAGRDDDASRYLAMYRERAGHEPELIMPAELTDLPEEESAADEGTRAFALGAQLVWTDPGLAIGYLEHAAQHLDGTEDHDVLGRLHQAIGECRLLMKEHDAARKSFDRLSTRWMDGPTSTWSWGAAGTSPPWMSPKNGMPAPISNFLDVCN